MGGGSDDCWVLVVHSVFLIMLVVTSEGKVVRRDNKVKERVLVFHSMIEQA